MIAYDRTVFCRSVFSDETAGYRQPPEPKTGDQVTVWLRLIKDCGAEVFLCCNGERTKLLPERTDRMFDYCRAYLTAGRERVSYYFEIHWENQTFYYHKLGLRETLDPAYAFCFTPGFSVPEWARGVSMYQIFVDRFCNGDPSNDVVDGEYSYVDGLPVEQVKKWDALPADLDVGCFYGGDLEGVRQKLDYLQYLGVECIYFNPLFVSPSNHKYDSQDYDHIDPHFGKIVKDGGASLAEGDGDNRHAKKYQIRTTSPENLEASDTFFASLVEEIHRRGMRVILDGVFNHCGSFHKWMDREGLYRGQEGYEPGAYQTEKSPYRDYFRFLSERWPDNDDYEGWWGYDTLPKLNYEASRELREHILQTAEKWVSPPYGADGWRLDVAADLGHSEAFNHEFWQEFRRRVKAANPDALILAEHYGDPSAWLSGDQWDSVMNYDAFMEPVSYFLTGMEKHSDAFQSGLLGNGRAFFDSMALAMARFSNGSLYTAMNELSNHDHSRFLTRTNMRVGRTEILGPESAGEDVSVPVLRQAAMIQFTWPGAPTVYYGDETGLCGWTDPDSRRSYPWGKEDWELIEYHRYLFELHRQNPALRHGSIKELTAESGLIAYGRFQEGNCLVVIINQSKSQWQASIPVWEIGILDDTELERIMLTDERGYNVGRISYRASYGHVIVTMEPCSGMILRKKEE